MKHIGNYNNINDYLPLFNAVLITDLFVITLSNIGFIQSKVLKKWYAKYNLSAVLADVLVILLVLILTRFLYSYLFDTFSLVKFISLAVALQIMHDISFYLFISSVPKGVNNMIDTFKEYATEASYKAILSDSGMMIMAYLVATYLVNQSTNTNIIVLIFFTYLLPYLLYN